MSSASSLLKDPSKLSFESTATRRLVIGSYWALIILAVPLWWYTTSIERLSLPTSRVLSSREAPALGFQIDLHVDAGRPEDTASATGALNDTLGQWHHLLPEVWAGLDTRVHSMQTGDIIPEGLGIYTISTGGDQTTVRDRHLSFPTADISTHDNASKLAKTLMQLLAPYTSSSDIQDRVVQYAPRYRLAFTLLNEDAAAGQAVRGWDIEEAISRNLSPILARLSSLHNFTIESQVQFHAPLAFKPTPITTSEGEAYGLTPEDLTVFVNSAQWTLSSSVSNDPVLNFVLFVPSANQRPLHILNADGTPSQSTAFLLPQWGGIVLLNPAPTPDSHTHLSPASLSPIMRSFSTQLLALLGVPSLPPSVRSVQQGDTTLTDWQIDALLRRRMLENIEKSQETLLSIVQLVGQIENMPVGKGVKGDVLGALDALDKAYASAHNTTTATLLHTAQALTLASRAFFNPGMLALLYFPAEHKYAVYTPLFASVAVPLVVAVMREVAAWKKSRKEKAEGREVVAAAT